MKAHQAMQCLARIQQLEKRGTCGVSLLVRLARAGRGDAVTRGLARAGRGDAVTRGLAMGLSEGLPMAHNASTIAKGDGTSLRKAEGMPLIGDDQGEGLLEVSAAASSSTVEDSISKGEEGCWVVTRAPLMVTCSESAQLASDCSVDARHQTHVA